MNFLKPNQLFFALLATSSFASTSAVASGITHDLRKGSGGPSIENGGFAEFTIGASHSKSAIADKVASEDNTEQDNFFFQFTGSYRYKGIFFDALGNDDLTIGFTAWANDQWVLDLIGLRSSSICIGESCRIKQDDTIEERNDKLNKGNGYNNTGFRLTGYFGQTILQSSFYKETAHGDGFSGSLLLGRSWQVQNWNFHASTNLKYLSKDAVHGWVGVDAYQATDRYPIYQPDEGYIGGIELGASYPLTEHIVARATLIAHKFSNVFSESAHFKDDNSYHTNITFSYVF